MATDTSGDERDDELTASNDEALAADDTTSTSEAAEGASDDAVEVEAAATAAKPRPKAKRASGEVAKTGTTTATAKRDKAPKRDKGERKGVRKFLHEVIVEMKKVVTPTRRELWRYVGVVLGFLIIMMAIVTLLDFLFGFGSSWIFGNGTDLFPAGPQIDPTQAVPATPDATGVPVPDATGAPATPATP